RERSARAPRAAVVPVFAVPGPEAHEDDLRIGLALGEPDLPVVLPQGLYPRRVDHDLHLAADAHVRAALLSGAEGARVGADLPGLLRVAQRREPELAGRGDVRHRH